MHRVLRAFFFVAFAAMIGCGKSSPSRSGDWFEDITDRCGIEVAHDPGPTGNYFIPQSMVGGCGIFDCDGDGKFDLLLLQATGPNTGKKNALLRQASDGKFADISAGSGLDLDGYNCGVAIGDIDNDGKPDVLITQYVGAKLFHNEGGGKFRDITIQSGVNNPLWGASASFFDYDRDGFLDLVIVNYIDYDPSWPCQSADGQRDYCGPKTFPGTASKLFRNRGKDQLLHFEDVSVSSGIAIKTGPGLGVYCADLTGDDWSDILITNDGKPNHLWINQKNGTFKDEAYSRGIAMTGMGSSYANMGIAVGDVDADGLSDFYVTHLTSETNTLWKQGPIGMFRDMTTATDVLKTKWRGTGFGTLMADLDCDGHLDLAIVNGRVDRGLAVDAPNLPEFWRVYAERNQLLRNDGKGRFVDVSESNPAFSKQFNVARGLACGDVDGDGRPDLLIQATADRFRLFRNVVETGNWLAIRCIDPKLGGRDMIGTQVRVSVGDKTWLRILQPSESYLSSSAPELLIGFGDLAEYTKIDVVWPDGSKESFPAGKTNQRLVLNKGQGGS
jgi:enediyne biosynthesis protein E4